MKKFLAALLLLVSGSALAQMGKPVPDCPMQALAYMREATFVRYLEEFQRDARRYGVGCYRTYAVYFDETLPEEMAGYCVPGDRIVINKKMWHTLSGMEKWVLMYHELGHCALNLDHLTVRDRDIMNPHLLPDSISRPFWEDMKERMFRAAQEEQKGKL